MDEFDFHPSNWSPGDTTFENPNYHEFVENVKDENPDTDFRTANEKLEDEKRDELFNPEGTAEFPTEGESVLGEDSVKPEDVDVFEEGKTPFDDTAPVQTGFGGEQQEAPQFTEKEERFIKSKYAYDAEEHAMLTEHTNESDTQSVLRQVNKIRSNQKWTDTYDRDGDGEYTIVDRYDLSRMNYSPEEIQVLNQRWLEGLANNDRKWRVHGGLLQNRAEGPLGLFHQLPGEMPRWLVPFWATDGNMTRYMGRRRRHALTKQGDDLSPGALSGVRQNILGPSLEFAKNTLSTPERLFSVATGGDFIGASTPVTDWVFNHKDPMSANSMYMDPVQKSFGDHLVAEATYYGLGAALTYLTMGKGARLVLQRGAMAAGTSTKIGATMNAAAGGMKYVWGGGMLKGVGTTPMVQKGMWGLLQQGVHTGKNLTKVGGQAWIETFPAAMFRDTFETGYKDWEDEAGFGQRLLKLYPESAVFGRQWHAGLESPLGKQFSYAFGVSTIDGGFSMGLMGMFGGGRLLAKSVGLIPPKNAAQLKTSTSVFDSTHASQPLKDGSYYHDISVQKANDIQEAAETQLSLFDDGPGNPYYNPDNTPAQDFSTYGPHKNGQELPGQGNVPDRAPVRQAINDLDEIDGQVTIEGGSTGQLIGPVQLRSGAKYGLDNATRKGLVQSLINDPVYKAQITSLPSNRRTIGEMHPGTLKRLQELEGRDAASLSPAEFWGKLFLEQPLSTKAGDSELATFTLENLQIADALNSSLLLRVRDLAAGTTEMLGKTDIFATHGPMRNVADNLVLGLSEAKRTRYTWGLVREVLNE